MPKILKGNFQTRNPVDVVPEQDKSLEERFEREALKRLGGSIAFVSKKKVAWDLKGGSKGKRKGKS
jgi:hypothetical protein